MKQTTLNWRCATRPLPRAIVASLLIAITAQCSLASNNSLPPQTDFLTGSPLYFEANQGQVGPDTKFVATGQNCNVLLEPTKASLILTKRAESEPAAAFQTEASPGERQISEIRTVRMILQGANQDGAMTGLEEKTAKANYLVGDDSSAWHIGVPLYGRVQVDQVYPGVRLVYYANESAKLEYDFVLQPGIAPDQISFRVEGADKLNVDASGDLVLKIGSDEVRQKKPVLYQIADGRRVEIAGGYRLTGEATVAFRVGSYDHQIPLVIDPVLNFSTFLGGSKADAGTCIAIDATGIYVAGQTVSKDLATTPGALSNSYAGGLGAFGDAFVAKYDKTSTNLIYLTYLGGKTDDGALGIAVDSSGDAYVTGFTDSKDFPVYPTNSVLLAQINGVRNNAFRIPATDAFVTELDPTGSSIIFSTLLGGSKRDAGMGIAVDSTGVYVAGLTESTNFVPIPNGYQTIEAGDADAFVAKIVGGTNYVYCTYLGGTNLDFASSIAVDSLGNACITGTTVSTNFPTANSIVLNGLTFTNLNTDTNVVGLADAFISKLSADGRTLLYSSYWGSSNSEAGIHIVVDSSDNALVTGYTDSTNFPVTISNAPPYSDTNFLSHVFVTKVDPNGVLLYSTQFGGEGTDHGLALAVDAIGNAYVAGSTTSTNFFTTNAWAYGFLVPTNISTYKRRGTTDAFVTVLDNTGTRFLYSAYLGGEVNDQINGIAVEPGGLSAYIVGQTTSQNFPTTNAPQSLLGRKKNIKSSDAFVGRIDFGFP